MAAVTRQTWAEASIWERLLVGALVVLVGIVATLVLVTTGVRAAGCSMTGTLVDAQGIPAVNLHLTGFGPLEPIALQTTRPEGTVYTDTNIKADPNGNTGVLAGTITPGLYLYEARSGTCVASFSVSVGAAGAATPTVAPALTPVPTLPVTDTAS